ncbi:GIY-YIG nuclease family protein [Flavobacteriaceae bacterium F89]|uniref:GIY-YIG nuclease family protein n=1 Tax=Cerina litoralis TaxID=2874477 RepID=A0AAE3ETJ6_9FLAO|nr:exonuclease domain-containing protein [Cerina litoralis]MCG2460703.1 GIY-YIG nuclease family protein [Cerina litoralis]
MYTIVDIETTGNGIQGNKITEISIFKFDGAKIIDEFTSLVNPECEIPYFITRLTGIDVNMVRHAPKLRDIAQNILEITEGAIFVAHSVNFDYNVIKNEFKSLGLSFVRKKLCTVRLARKLVPGLNSYSLGKLCSSLNIPLTDRHRARGDAHATVLLFQQLQKQDGALETIQTFLNARSQESTLPPALPKIIFDRLPTKPGVYFFKNQKGEVIYVGKANNLQKRVLGHFYDKSSKEMRLCQDTVDIDFELAGNELIALLMESAAIKKYFPIYNKAQKRKPTTYTIFTYEDRRGILHLAYNKVKSVPSSLGIFYTLAECRACLQDLCERYVLCPKYCHLQENVPHCSHYSLQYCKGICRGKEAVLSYNKRAVMAIEELKSTEGSFVLKEKGRKSHEDAFVLVRDGIYAGYGYIGQEENISTLEDFMAYLVPRKNTLETERIIRSYLLKHPNKLAVFPN